MNMRCFNPQFFIASRVGDAALEQDWEHSVRNHDHRLGVILDAVTVLCAAVPREGLQPAERLSLDRLEALAGSADPRETGETAEDTAFTAAEIDQLVLRLLRLRQEDPEAAADIVRRIVDEVGPHAPAVTS
jgi:hypothetical protein